MNQHYVEYVVISFFAVLFFRAIDDCHTHVVSYND